MNGIRETLMNTGNQQATTHLRSHVYHHIVSSCHVLSGVSVLISLRMYSLFIKSTAWDSSASCIYLTPAYL